MSCVFSLICPCNFSGSSADELDEISPLPTVPNFVSIFANDGNNQQQAASTSPPNRNRDIFKSRFPTRGNSSVSTDGEIATDSISG